MFTPLNENEWKMMKTKAWENVLSVGNFFMPINDKDGELIWNNGSCKYALDLLSLVRDLEYRDLMGDKAQFVG